MANSLSCVECVVSFEVSHIMTPNDDDVVKHINRNAGLGLRKEEKTRRVHRDNCRWESPRETTRNFMFISRQL